MTHEIAAAKWPLEILGALIGVLAIAAIPIAIVEIGDGGPRSPASWAAIIVGGLLLVGLAAAWVTFRAHREGEHPLQPHRP